MTPDNYSRFEVLEAEQARQERIERQREVEEEREPEDIPYGWEDEEC